MRRPSQQAATSGQPGEVSAGTAGIWCAGAVHSEVVLAVAAILVLGVAAQWVGWRVQVPSIVFLLAAGLVVGPLTGLIDPDDLFGDLLFPFVSLAVAVILFEGAFALGTTGVRAAGRTVWMLLTVGAAITMGLTAVAAHWILDIPWGLSWVLAGVLVVTGPTVIGPLVRSIGLRGRVASVLEAEGALIDPLGAILTVLLFQAFFDSTGSTPLPLDLAATLAIGTGVGLAGAGVLILALMRFLLPDDLHNVATLSMVVLSFAVADVLRPEAGLVAVTVMGFAIAGQRRVEVHDLLEFNETLRTLFIAGLFILLGARIDPVTLRELEWRNLVFLVLLVVLVRPLSVAAATLGSPLRRAERVFVGATAPRGIVAAAIASIFSLRLAEVGVEGSQVLVSATFTVIAGTVLLSGVGARPLGRRLGVIDTVSSPVVVLGSNEVGRALAEVLERREVPVRVVSLDRREVASARMSGLAAVQGSVLDDGLWAQIDESGVSRFVAMTVSDEANVLACRRVAGIVGRRNVHRVAPRRDEHRRLSPFVGSGGRVLDEDLTLAEMQRRLESGESFRATTLTEEFDLSDHRAANPDARLIATIRDGEVDFVAVDRELKPRAGDVVVVLGPDRSDRSDPDATPVEGRRRGSEEAASGTDGQ